MAHASAASYFPGKPPSPKEKKNLEKNFIWLSFAH